MEAPLAITGSTNSQITTGLQMANTNMHYHAYPNYCNK